MPYKPIVKKVPQIVEANKYLVKEVIDRGIKDVALGKATGVAYSNYNNWRKGKLLYSFEKLAEIAEVLEIKISIKFEH